MIKTTLNVPTYSEKFKLTAIVKLVGLMLVTFMFHCFIAVFHQHFVSLLISELASNDVCASAPADLNIQNKR